MNILIVVPNMLNKEDSNSNIANIIAMQLKKRGHDISFFCDASSLSSLSDLKSREIDGTWYEIFSNIYQRRLAKYMSAGEKLNKKKLAVFFRHPQLFIYKLYYHLFASKNYDDKIARRIYQFCKKQKIDMILTVSYPFNTSLIVARLKIKVCKVMYQLDPYSNCFLEAHRRGEALREEKYIYHKFDGIITSDLIYEEHSKGELSPYIKKLRWIPYPNIRRIRRTNTKLNIILNEGKINCCYIGKFYDDIRNPEKLLCLFHKIKDTRIVLHLIGQGCENVVEEYKLLMGEQLVCHGSKSLEVAINAMLDADILVSLNNKLTNMLPGKLFDYISTGKPIINMYQVDNCPSLPYMEKYPLHCNVDLQRELDDEMVQTVETFCDKNAGRCIDSNEIHDLYLDNYEDTVGEKFERYVREFYECYKDGRNISKI